MTTADVPCSTWATIDDIQRFAGSSQAEYGETDQIEELLEIASAWLYRATARKYPGVCTRTVRPMRQRCTPFDTRARVADFDSRTGTFASSYVGGRNEGVHEITLGVWPVREILTVKVDGAILTPTAYRLDDARWLVRIDGNGWPSQDLKLDDTQVGTWSVRFTFGDDPPTDGVRAACVLANELWLAIGNDEKCRLPRRTQTIARQGVTISLMDPTELMDKGRFGIPEIDYFVRSVNPHGIARPAAISSPHIGRPVRRVGTQPGS